MLLALAFGALMFLALQSARGGDSSTPPPSDESSPVFDPNDVVKTVTREVLAKGRALEDARDVVTGLYTTIGAKLGGPVAGAAAGAASALGGAATFYVTGSKTSALLGAGLLPGVAAGIGSKVGAEVADKLDLQSPPARWILQLQGAQLFAVLGIFGLGALPLLIGYLVTAALIVAVLEYFAVKARRQIDAVSESNALVNRVYLSMIDQMRPKVGVSIPDWPTAYRLAANFADGMNYEMNRLRFEHWRFKNSSTPNWTDKGFREGRFAGWPESNSPGQHPMTYISTPRPPRLVENLRGPYVPPDNELKVTLGKQSVPGLLPPGLLTGVLLQLARDYRSAVQLEESGLRAPFMKTPQDFHREYPRINFSELLNQLRAHEASPGAPMPRQEIPLRWATDFHFIPVFEAGRRAGNVAAYIIWMAGDRGWFTSDPAHAQRGIAEKAFVGTLQGETLAYEGDTYDWKTFKK